MSSIFLIEWVKQRHYYDSVIHYCYTLEMNNLVINLYYYIVYNTLIRTKSIYIIQN